MSNWWDRYVERMREAAGRYPRLLKINAFGLMPLWVICSLLPWTDYWLRAPNIRWDDRTLASMACNTLMAVLVCVLSLLHWRMSREDVRGSRARFERYFVLHFVLAVPVLLTCGGVLYFR